MVKKRYKYIVMQRVEKGCWIEVGSYLTKKEAITEREEMKELHEDEKETFVLFKVEIDNLEVNMCGGE